MCLDKEKIEDDEIIENNIAEEPEKEEKLPAYINKDFTYIW